jgi:hypothetical protein
VDYQTVATTSVVFNLPQALKYEAELNAIKDQQQRQNAQRLVHPDTQNPANRLSAGSGNMVIKTLPYLPVAQSPNNQPPTTPSKTQSSPSAPSALKIIPSTPLAAAVWWKQ